MGSQESKFQEPQTEDAPEAPQSEGAPSTPILTPLDPRSPSVNIARTPLDAILGDKNAEDAPETGEAVAKQVVLGVDPRSPTVEFNRTPIVVTTVAKEKSSKLLNKNFDNVRKSIVQTTPISTPKTSIIPPKFLGSSPISASVTSVNANKRKSLVGLLETNVDFTETDLDSVCRVNYEDNELSKQVEAETAELADQLEPEDTKLASEVETLEINSEEVIEAEEEKVVETEAEEEKVVEIEKTPEKTINVTAQVKDFDKKLTNLIYQDDSEDDSKLDLKFSKIKDNNRTPLGVRNGNEEVKKTKLKVSDKPRKLEISKIPVFKDKFGRKIGVQCENTPPSKMEEKLLKTKVSQWDGEKSLII